MATRLHIGGVQRKQAVNVMARGEFIHLRNALVHPKGLKKITPVPTILTPKRKQKVKRLSLGLHKRSQQSKMRAIVNER